MSQSEAIHQFPYTPYLHERYHLRFLCSLWRTPPSPHHITTPRPATPIYIHTAPCTQEADRLTHPASKWAQIFVRQRGFVPLRPSGSSRMVEAPQLETAVSTRRSTLLAPAGPPWRKGRQAQSRRPLLRSEYVILLAEMVRITSSSISNQSRMIPGTR